jgi:LPS O-antigen subunit length determinant protein (WzzB/FepE family)
MSQTVQDDEIDLFELFATLWAGKWVIAFVTAMALLGGYAYTQLATKVYQLQAKLDAPACAVSGAEYVDWDCEEALFSAAQRRLADQWTAEFPVTLISFSASQPIVTMQTTEPLAFQVYQTTLDQVMYDVEVSLRQEAARVQSILELPNLQSVSQSDIAVQANLRSKLIGNWVQENSGQIGTFSILPNSFKVLIAPKSNLVLALSLVLGGFVGAAIVLLRKVISDRRDVAH